MARSCERWKVISAEVLLVTVPVKVLISTVKPPLYVPAGMTMKKSVGTVLSSGTNPQDSVTSGEPPADMTNSGSWSKSVRTVALPLTGIPLSWARKRISLTASSPVRESFRTAHRFLKVKASDSLTASIGKAP